MTALLVRTMWGFALVPILLEEKDIVIPSLIPDGLVRIHPGPRCRVAQSRKGDVLRCI
jgi:hypothetical protein